MKLFNSYSNSFNSMLSLTLFVLVLFPDFILIPILFLVTIISIGIIQQKVAFKWNTLQSLFVLFYLAYLVGSIYTDHPEIAWRYLEYKFSFLIFPLIFAFLPDESKSLRIPAYGLILGVVLATIYGMVQSAICYSQFGDWICFISSRFSTIHHPTYFSVYSFFAMILLVVGWYNDWRFFNLKVVIPLVLICLIAQIFCLSLAGLLFLLLFICFAGIIVIRNKYGKRAFFVALVGLPLGIYLTLRIIPGVNAQLNSALNYVVEYINDPKEFVLNKQTYVGGNEARLIMWTAAFLEIKEHPLGVGTGNVDDHLAYRLRELGQPPSMIEKQLNPHNQFLQTGLELGILGLSILVLIIVFALKAGFYHRSNLLILLPLNMAFNSLFESMLQKQSGIVFYTILFLLIYMLRSQQSLNSEKRNS